MSEPEKKLRKKMEIFRFSEGEELTQEMMPYVGVDETLMKGFAKIAEVGLAQKDIDNTVCLFREPGEGGMSLVYAWFKSGFVLPKHSHDADCLYYVIAGSLKMGTQVLGKGDGVFIPANFDYTYEVGPDGLEVLEFRTANKFHIKFKGNDEAHLEKMAEATRNGKDTWPTEKAPSELNAEPAE